MTKHSTDEIRRGVAAASEGFCPAGHGPLERDGWCADCHAWISVVPADGLARGLDYTIRIRRPPPVWA